MGGNLTGSVVEFRVESHTANLSSWFARIQRTHSFLTRESVISALTDTDWLVLDQDAMARGYDPDGVYGDQGPFFATPAMPIHATVRRHVVGAHLCEPPLREKAQEHLLAYGMRDLITPGSRFRALIWGPQIPRVEAGDVHFIGKERAVLAVEKAEQHEARSVDERGKGSSRGQRFLPAEIELFKFKRRGEEESEYDRMAAAAKAMRVITETERYVVASVLTDRSLVIGGFRLPAVEGVTV